MLDMRQSVLFIDAGHLEQTKRKKYHYGDNWRIDYQKVETWVYDTLGISRGDHRPQFFDGDAMKGEPSREPFKIDLRKRLRFKPHFHPTKVRVCDTCHTPSRVQKGVDSDLTLHLATWCYRYPEVVNYVVITADGDLAVPFTYIRHHHNYQLPPHLMFDPDQPIQRFPRKSVTLIHCQADDPKQYGPLAASADHTEVIPAELFKPGRWLYRSSPDTNYDVG